MSVLYRLYQNNNKKNTKAYGKWYAKAVQTNVYGTDELAQEVQRNCSMKKSDVKAVIEELCEVMARELGNSHAIKLSGLGTFRATLSGRGAANAEDYSVQKHVKGIHMRFIPDQTDLDKKTAKTFKNQCSLVCVGYDNDGTIRPLSAYVAPQP